MWILNEIALQQVLPLPYILTTKNSSLCVPVGNETESSDESNVYAIVTWRALNSTWLTQSSVSLLSNRVLSVAISTHSSYESTLDTWV